MPQSLTKLYVHLVFSTKYRRAWLDKSIRPRVHAFLAQAIRDLDSPWVVVGGVADHVHILFDIGKLIPPAKFVEHAKRTSSKFVKTLGPEYAQFYWQRGYGMFTVSPRYRDVVERYVRNQEQHHRRSSFKQEYRAILIRQNVDYDEKYVWD